jgi:hypothetical protein
MLNLSDGEYSLMEVVGGRGGLAAVKAAADALRHGGLKEA